MVANTKVLSNGAVYDLDAKRIVSNPGGGSAGITSQVQASAMARLRWERAQKAAIQGVGRASLSNKGSALAAWADINANMAGYAMTERSIGAVKAAEFVGKATGFTPDKAQQGQTMPDNGIVMMISDGALELAAGILAAMRADNAQHGHDEE